MTTTDLLVADGDGAVSRAPEALEPVSAESPEVLQAMADVEPDAISALKWRLALVDAEHGPAAPASPIDGATDARALAAYIDRAGTLCGNADKAVARERGKWDDPATVNERVKAIQDRAVADAEALYTECRDAADAFVARRAASTAPSADDVATLDMGRAILAHASPADSHAWFMDAYHRGGRSWPLLRMLAKRVSEKPPGHILGTAFQAAFTELAERPFDDPATDSRAAREYAADIVDRVRGRLENWAHSAHSHTM